MLPSVDTFARLSISLVCLLSFSTFVHADFTISEVDLANNKLELINTGSTTEDISFWWWCIDGKLISFAIDEEPSIDRVF